MVTPARPDEIRSITYEADLAALAASDARLLAAVAALPDQDLTAPSALPGWTRAHVIAHLARSADGLRHLLVWARTGVETPMYASREARAADIEAGAAQPAPALRDDLAAALATLADDLAALPLDVRDAGVRLFSGADVVAGQLPRLRLRETEIHHADLLVGYGPDDWPSDFVGTALDALAAAAVAGREIPVQFLAEPDGRVWRVAGDGPTLTGPRGQLLAWLVGRGTGPGLAVDPPGSVPTSPAWV